MTQKIIILLLTLSLLLTSCSALPALQPEPSPSPSATELPAPTVTPTITPTATPTLSPLLGSEQAFPAAGYSLRLPLGLIGQPQDGHLTLTDPSQKIVFFVMGSRSNPRSLNNADLLESALLLFFTGNNDTYTAGEQRPISINGSEGFTTDLTGVLLNDPIEGQAFVVQKEDGQFIFGFGFANISQEPTLWQAKASDMFAAMLQSAHFLSPEQGNANEACDISTDPTYGYTETNPIRVGGGVTGGETHAGVYFENLAGPDGHAIQFSHTGSILSGDVTLEVYEVIVQDQTLIFYVDHFSPIQLQAPVGFTCLEAIIQDSL